MPLKKLHKELSGVAQSLGLSKEDLVDMFLAHPKVKEIGNITISDMGNALSHHIGRMGGGCAGCAGCQCGGMGSYGEPRRADDVNSILSENTIQGASVDTTRQGGGCQCGGSFLGDIARDAGSLAVLGTARHLLKRIDSTKPQGGGAFFGLIPDQRKHCSVFEGCREDPVTGLRTYQRGGSFWDTLEDLGSGFVAGATLGTVRVGRAKGVKELGFLPLSSMTSDDKGFTGHTLVSGTKAILEKGEELGVKPSDVAKFAGQEKAGEVLKAVGKGQGGGAFTKVLASQMNRAIRAFNDYAGATNDQTPAEQFLRGFVAVPRAIAEVGVNVGKKALELGEQVGIKPSDVAEFAGHPEVAGALKLVGKGQGGDGIFDIVGDTKELLACKSKLENYKQNHPMASKMIGLGQGGTGDFWGDFWHGFKQPFKYAAAPLAVASAFNPALAPVAGLAGVVGGMGIGNKIKMCYKDVCRLVEEGSERALELAQQGYQDLRDISDDIKLAHKFRKVAKPSTTLSGLEASGTASSALAGDMAKVAKFFGKGQGGQGVEDIRSHLMKVVSNPKQVRDVFTKVVRTVRGSPNISELASGSRDLRYDVMAQQASEAFRKGQTGMGTLGTAPIHHNINEDPHTSSTWQPHVAGWERLPGTNTFRPVPMRGVHTLPFGGGRAEPQSSAGASGVNAVVADSGHYPTSRGMAIF